MRILFATGRTFVPDRVGGADRSAHSLLELLGGRGHLCEAIATMSSGWRHEATRGLRLVSSRRWSAWPDRRNGYVTRRALAWALPEVFRQQLRSFQPDLVLTQLEGSEDFAEIALEAGVPVAVRVPDTQFTHFTGRLARSNVLFVSNSRFVAGRLQERFGIVSKVVYSAVRLDNYRTRRDGAERITFVNPHPLKGFDLALEIASLLPARRFLFQEAWRLEAAELHRLRARLAPHPNVTLGRITQDMRPVYGATRLLIVPSTGEESLPRVILEAQASGIPVLGRDVGGIGEVLAEGGVLLPRAASAADWTATIEAILGDPARYATLSAGAERNARRPDFDAETIADRFLAVVQDHLAGLACGQAPGAQQGYQGAREVGQ